MILVYAINPFQYNWTVKNNNKSRNIYQQKTLTLNPNPGFYQDKLENNGINVTPDKNRSRKVKKPTLTLAECKLHQKIYQ